MKKIISKKIWIDILAIFVIGIMSYTLLYNKPFLSNFGGDTGDGAYDIMAGVAQTINNGELPLWNPSLWGGMTSVGNPVAQVFYPITYLLCKLCYNDEVGMLSYSVIYYSAIIHMFILAVGFYILFRTIKCNQIISFSIACLATFTGSAFRMHGWLYIYSGLVYIPIFIAALHLAMEKLDRNGLKYWAISGAILGIAGLASTSHGVLYVILVFGLMYLVYLWKYHSDKIMMLKLTLCCFLTGILGIGIMSISLFPFVEFLSESYRSIEGADTIAGNGKMPFDSFIYFSTDISDIKAIFGDYYGWMAIGTILVLFLIIGFFSKVSNFKEVYWIGVSTLLLSVLYASGIVFPQIFYYIPFYNNIREPYLYTFLFIIGVAIICAYGMNSVYKKENITFNSQIMNVPAMYICCSIMIIGWLVPVKYNNKCLLLVILFFSLFFIRFIRNRKVYVALFCLIALSIVGVEYSTFQNKIINNSLYKVDDAIKSVSTTNLNALKLLGDDLPTDDDAYRIVQWTSEKKAYPSNIWSVWGYNEVVGYMNPMYKNAMNVHTNWSLEKQLELLNVKYLMCTDSENEEFMGWMQQLGLKEIRRVNGMNSTYDEPNEGNVIVFQNSNRMGTAWIVQNYIPYTDDTSIEELNNQINSTEFNPKEEALINIDSSKEELKHDYTQNEESDIVVKKYGTNTIEMKVKVSNEALLVTSEVMQNGWNVYIDGKKSDILEVNTGFRGAIVPKGEHDIQFKYIPLTFIIGTIFSSLCILIVLIIIWYSYRREKINEQ